MKRYLITVLMALALTLLVAGASRNATAATAAEKIDAGLLRELSERDSAEFIVTLTTQADVSSANALKTKEAKAQYVYDTLTAHAAVSQRGLIAQLDGIGAAYTSFWVTNMVVVEGNLALAQQIAQRTDVERLDPNPTLKLDDRIQISQRTTPFSPSAIEWSITHIKATDVWALGYTGTGAVLGGQDTGYQWDHPALKDKYRGWDGATADHNYNWHDAIHSNGGSNICGANLTVPCDDHWHGTHTMGTMVGDDGGSNQIGVAPDAKWIGCRNMDFGDGTPVTYSECFQWFLAPTDTSDANADPSKAPHAITNSWSCPTFEGCNAGNFATMNTIVDNLVASGVVVVVAAGNYGSSCSSVSTPAAIFDNSFTVGNTTSSDALSGSSSRGPVTVDGSNRMKPDISAPGTGIRSSRLNGTYGGASGTSMAAPHVTGLIGLIIDANPALAGNVNAIENIIKSSAVELTTTQGCGNDTSTSSPNNAFGHGRIDALAAVNAAINYVPTSVSVESVSAESTPTYAPTLWIITTLLLSLLAMTAYTIKQRPITAPIE